MARKLLVTVALLVALFALPGSAAAQGASECQPAAGQTNAGLARQFGGLGQFAKPVATSEPGAAADLNKALLFNCPRP